MNTSRKTILILGSGFGGLYAALELEKSLKKEKKLGDFEIILVDRNPYHLYTPALYEVATTLKLDANVLALKEVVTIPLEEILKGKSVTFLRGEIQHIDISRATTTIEDHHKCQEIPYAFLVLALGSETNTFDIPGLEEHGLVLKDLKDAIRLRDTIEHAFMDREEVNIVIGGGGTTGVEVAGALHGFLERLERVYTKERKGTKITIIEGSPAILASFTATIRRWAETRLGRLGIKVIRDTLIDHVEKNEITIRHTRTGETNGLPYSILIWTGGVKVNRLIEDITIAKDIKNRCLVNTRLEVETRGIGATNKGHAGPLESHPNIYAIGDNTCFYDLERGMPIAGNAPYAITQGRISAKNIVAEIIGSKKIDFKPKMPPYVIPIGGKYAIADLGFVRFHGIPAWILKQFVEPNYYRRILPWSRVLPLWLKGLRLFLKND